MGFSKKVHNAVNFVKIKGLEKASPLHFWEVDGETIDGNVFSGRLVKIANDSYEFEGKERATVKMLFGDGGENYQLDTSLNSISRGLINTILGYIDTRKKGGLKNGKLDLEISLYMNKENYKSAGFYINGERGNWRLTWEEQKALIEDVKNSKGEVLQRDFSAFDEKLQRGVEEIQEYISVTDFQEEVKEEKQNFSTKE